MERQKVTFTRNQAELITLDRNDSKEVEGRNGPQFMRILDGDTRILFADPDLENAIVQSGARKGDVVQIVKRANGWEAGIMPDTAARPTRFNTQSPAAAHPTTWRQPATQMPTPQPTITPQSVALVAALKAAIDAANEAERYAATQGRAIHFAEVDIRTMANSIICRNEGGRS